MTPGDAPLKFQWDPQDVAAIETGFSRVAEVYELSSRLKELLTGEPQPHVRALVWALDYHERTPSGGRVTPDDLYGPMITTASYAYPEPLSSTTPETLAAWSDATQLFQTNDVVVARLGDLLWILKVQPRPDRQARAAQAAMRRIWGHRELASVHRSVALIRALQIASELRDSGLVSNTASELVSAVRETLLGEEWAPGVALPMIEALSGLSESAQPDGIEDLIADSRRRYADDPFIVESLLLLEMQRAGGDAEGRQRLALEAIGMWRDQAEKREGLLAVAHLERALELARNEGLADEARELRLLLQQPKSAEDLGMRRVEGEVTIPTDVFEGFVNHFVETAGPDETFIRLALYSPISDVDSDMSVVRDQMQQFPIQHLFSTVVTNNEGVPIAHITTDEQKFDHALNRHHSMAIMFWGSVLGMITERVTTGALLAPSDIRRLVAGEFIDDSLAEGIAQAYQDIQDGDYEAALHRLLVRIERVVRSVARNLGLPVFREPTLDGKWMGVYRGLGDLLNLIEGRVPENQRRYFMVLLTERTGINLRNRSAHGLISTVSREEAALALHVLLVMSQWSVRPPDTGEGSSAWLT